MSLCSQEWCSQNPTPAAAVAVSHLYDMHFHPLMPSCHASIIIPAALDANTGCCVQVPSPNTNPVQSSPNPNPNFQEVPPLSHAFVHFSFILCFSTSLYFLKFTTFSNGLPFTCPLYLFWCLQAEKKDRNYYLLLANNHEWKFHLCEKKHKG